MEKYGNSALEITNLMYRYNDFIDAGDFEAAAMLFFHAKLKLVTLKEFGGYLDFLDMLHQLIRLYPDGTPKTKHLVTNPILEINEVTGKAKARAQYTVFQAVDGLPFQVIAGGRYHDEFECIDGEWHFAYRDFTLFDFQGNIDQHIYTDRLKLT